MLLRSCLGREILQVIEGFYNFVIRDGRFV